MGKPCVRDGSSAQIAAEQVFPSVYPLQQNPPAHAP